MTAAEAISGLIADIYCAAINSDRWRSVLEAAAKYVAGPEASLSIEIAEVGPDRNNFNRRDIWQKKLSLESPQGDAALGGEKTRICGNVFISYPANHASSLGVLETRICEHPMSPGSFDGPKKCVAGFALWSPVPDHGESAMARRRLELLLPHICRAVQICKAIAISQSRVAALTDTLDRLAAGIFLLNGVGQIVHANLSGSCMLKHGRILLSIREGPIFSGRKATAGRDARHIPKNTRGAAISMSDAPESDTQSDSLAYIAHNFPIAAWGAKQGGGDRQAVAGIRLHDPRLPIDDAVDRISREYRLAPRERQVLQAIVEGHSLTQIADRLSIAHSTMKTYLGRLFEKTSTEKQSDLIKLCAAYRSPFSGYFNAG
jgi:DNA-binding CsgD family transcriptional regulator